MNARSRWTLALAGLVACSGEPSSPPNGGEELPAAPIREWTAQGVRSLATRPLVAQSLVYFVASDTHIATAVDKATGAVQWRTTLPVSRPDRGGSGLALVSGVLVAGDSDLFGLDPNTGVIPLALLAFGGKSAMLRRVRD